MEKLSGQVSFRKIQTRTSDPHTRQTYEQKSGQIYHPKCFKTRQTRQFCGHIFVHVLHVGFKMIPNNGTSLSMGKLFSKCRASVCIGSCGACEAYGFVRRLFMSASPPYFQLRSSLLFKQRGCFLERGQAGSDKNAFRPICCQHFGPVSKEKSDFLPILVKKKKIGWGTKNAESAPNIGTLCGGGGGASFC